MTERRVRTPAGVQHFNQPMGSIIRRDAPPITLRSTMPGRRPPRRVPMPALSSRPPKTIQGPLRQISDALATIPAADQPQVAADIAHATAHQTLAEIARDLPILSQDEAKEVQDRLNLWIDKHPSLRKVRDWMDHIVNEYLGTGTAWGNITTAFGLPNATSDPVGFVSQLGALMLHWLHPAARTLGLAAAGDSWRWQLRDKEGEWIEMGAEVKWLWQGLERLGIVIGSPSPGMASVREHLTELIHQVPSNRLEVTKSAAEVVARIYESAEGTDKPDWEKLALVEYPALAEFAKRAKEQAIPITKWSNTGNLLPDELAIDPAQMSLEQQAETISRLIDYGFTNAQAARFMSIYAKAAYEIQNQGYRFKTADLLDKMALDKKRDLRDNGDVVIAIPPFNAIQLIEQGRYKTQFEINQSGGLYNPEMRAGDELLHQGLLEDIPVEKRPAYGFLAMPGEADSNDVAQYGSVRLVLKPGVRDRTTITFGDSLNGEATPIPLTGDVTDEQMFAARSMAPGDYTEAQIHGGVTLDDVEKIVIAPLKTPWEQKGETEDLVRIAEAHGIPVEGAPVSRAAQQAFQRPLFDPTPDMNPFMEAVYREEVERAIAITISQKQYGGKGEIPVYRVLMDEDPLDELHPDALVTLSRQFALDAARDNPGSHVMSVLVPMDKLGPGRKGFEEFTRRYQDWTSRQLKPVTASITATGDWGQRKHRQQAVIYGRGAVQYEEEQEADDD